MRLFNARAPWAAVVSAVAVLAVAQTATSPQEIRLKKALAEKPESAAEMMRSLGTRNLKAGVVPPGALRAAYEQKLAIAPKATSVPGAAGTWREYGKGNLRAATGWIDGNVSARIDNFAFDPVHKRLFAAVGTGGIWMSQAVGDDLSTLADSWKSVGDKLPSQANGGVAWTPDVDGDGDADNATDGTLISAGGEAVMGSGSYSGLGAYWTTDLGKTWTHATGFPDQVLVFQAVADPVNPAVIYIASSVGLYRSKDAGRSYVNVALPTGDCAGVTNIASKCFYANYVTDVAIKQPGGSTNVVCDPKGCPVVAAVGFRTGSTALFRDGTPQAPHNGVYRSETGEAGSFARVDVAAADTLLPIGFPPQARIGRIEFGVAEGPMQNHNYLYAIVQDAVAFNGGAPVDAPLDAALTPVIGQLPLVPFDTVFNGLYVSSDFGSNWVRMAERNEIATNVTTGTGMLAFGAQGGGPGGQTWYDAWIKPDPTRQTTGIPTRLTFGIEEIWQNRVTTGVPLNGTAQAGANDFKVIGAYNILGAEVAANVANDGTTTHADQHTAIYIPLANGGVCLIIGGDGGIFKQCKGAGVEMDNAGWGTGANTGIYALLPYGLGIAKDGTVYYGLQDNGSGLIDPRRDFQIFETLGGDGFYAEVDPDNSDVAYYESQNGGFNRTINRGASNTSIAPTYTRVQFDNWFRMDPLNAQHMVTAAQEIYETDNAQTVTGSTWVEVFNLGTNPETGAIRTTTGIEIHGSAVYVGGCGDCGASGNDTGFASVVATNVMDGVERVAETSAGWHLAAKRGLPSRYINGFAIDPTNPKIVYAAIGGYLSNLRPAGHYLDRNTEAAKGGNVYKSVNAGDDWVNISGDLPQASANSVVLKGNQLIVGTDIGAFISSDTNGTSWTTLGTTLPNVPVNMVRLKPKATAAEPDLLVAATFGRGVWAYEFKDGVVVPPVNPPPAGPPPVITPAPVVPGSSNGGTGRFGGGAFGGALFLAFATAAALRRRRLR